MKKIEKMKNLFFDKKLEWANKKISSLEKMKNQFFDKDSNEPIKKFPVWA